MWENFTDDNLFDEIEKSCEYLSFFCDWEGKKMSTVWRGNKYE